MTANLIQFMPVLAGSVQPIYVDPYWDYVSFVTEYMWTPRDISVNDSQLVPVGQPFRYPLLVDEYTPPEDGVSDQACYRWASGSSSGSSICLEDCSHVKLDDHDFEIKLRVRSLDTMTSLHNLCGRWYSSGSGNRSWFLRYNGSSKKLEFYVSTTGSTDYTDHCTFRLGTTTNDGMDYTEFLDGMWHDIIVTRSGTIITLKIDGMTGFESIVINSNSIYDPPDDYLPLHIGAVSADPSSRRINSGCWRGYINRFEMTVGTTKQLDVTFNNIWSYWWAGKYPQDNVVSNLNWSSVQHFDDDGLVHLPGYIGNYYPYDVGFNFLGQDFTIELFDLTFCQNDNDIQMLIGFGWPTTNKCWALFCYDDPLGDGHTGTLVFKYTYDGGTEHVVTLMTGLINGELITKTFAASRVGSTLHLYLDGIEIATETLTDDLYDISPSGKLSLYANASNGNAATDITRISAIRLTKGIGRYAGAKYRMPARPLPLTDGSP